MSMKSGLRHIFSGILVIALAITLSVPALATDLKSFSDVPSDFWAHDAIMDMVSRGMFAGTKAPDANGVGEFNPNGTMTRAQFIVVLTRYLYKDELATMPAGDTWFANNYELALNHGLVYTNEIGGSSNESLNKPCTRQEMALLLVRAAEQLGETPKQLVPTQNIADYNLTPTANSGKGVGTYYREYVRKCFSMGLIAGVDKNGTFMGGNSMTRAQAAMVIYRLLEPSTRPAVDFSIKGTTDPSSGLEVTTGSSWTEGQSHGVPKAGDKVTTKSGQTVVLQEKFGVLGFGQGVDIYTNVVYNGVSAKEGMASWFDQTEFIKSSLTGEMYTSQQWKALRPKISPVNMVGDYDGEVYNVYYKWNASTNSWKWIGPNIH